MLDILNPKEVVPSIKKSAAGIIGAMSMKKHRKSISRVDPRPSPDSCALAQPPGLAKLSFLTCSYLVGYI